MRSERWISPGTYGRPAEPMPPTRPSSLPLCETQTAAVRRLDDARHALAQLGGRVLAPQVLGQEREVDVAVGGDDRVIHRGPPRAHAHDSPARKSRDRIEAMAFPDVAALRARLRSRSRARASVRFWTGALHLARRHARSAAALRGRALRRRGPSDAPPGPRDVDDRRPRPAEWAKLLAPVPPPFYQDVFGASLHHPVSLGGDVETLYAYYPAMRRVLEILREARA